MHNQENRILFLDGLRGWAAFIVLLSHIFIQTNPISPSVRAIMGDIFIFHGGLAVILFFIVSGYSLSIGYLQTGDPLKLKRILLGRYFRLVVPILLACFIVYGVATAGWLPQEFVRPGSQNVVDLLQFALFDVLFRYNAATSPIPPLWTMSVEFMGSVLIIAMLAIVRRHRLRFLVYIVVLAIAYTTYPLYAAFIFGLLLAEVRPEALRTSTQRLLSTVATIALGPMLLSIAWIADPWPNRHILVLFACGLSICLFYSDATRRFLSNPVSSFLGSISFSLYLLHAATIHIFEGLFMPLGSSPYVIAAGGILIAAISVVLAWVFRPIDTLGIRVSRRVGRLLTASGAVYINSGGRTERAE
ncbi:MAG: acyltransferase [Pusillimonas sp.]